MIATSPDASPNLGGRQITEPLIASPGCADIGLSSITLSLPCGKQKRQNPAEWITGRESLTICAMPGLVGAVHPRVIRLAGCFSPQMHTLPMVAALPFQQTTDLLHFWNYRRQFMVNLDSDKVLGNRRGQSLSS